MSKATVPRMRSWPHEAAWIVLHEMATPLSDRTVHLLPPRQLRAALEAQNAQDLVIGVANDIASQGVVIYRGNLELLEVPYAWFHGSLIDRQHAFSDLSVIDYGNTISLGTHEVAVDAILYDLDPDYRRRAKALALALDTSFGGSVRRLRIERGLSQDSVPGVNEKTMARIERNEITQPHQRTLRALAAALGVTEDELGTY